MDCIRVSVKETENEVYEGIYTEDPTLRNKGISYCRQQCISNPSCMAWEYSPNARCYLSSSLKMPYLTKNEKEGAYSGIVKCQDDWNMLNLLVMIFLFGGLLVLVWYMLNRDKHKPIFPILPRFYFKR